VGISQVEREPEYDGDKGLNEEGFADSEMGEHRAAHVAGKKDGADDGRAGDDVEDGDHGLGDAQGDAD